MTHFVLDRTQWWLALHLQERLQAGGGDPPECSDELTGVRRAHRWLALFPFLREQVLEAVANVHEIQEETLLRVLHLSPEAAIRPAASWIDDLEDAVWAKPGRIAALSEGQGELRGLLNVATPWIEQAIKRLEAKLQAELRTGGGPCDVSSCLTLGAGALPELLLPLIARTLVLELNVRRVRGQLAGDTPSARFRDFCERLGHPDEALAILREYPVLGRSIVETLARWVNVSHEFFARLHADWNEIVSRFALEQPPGAIAAVEWNRGDLHHGGRAVVFVKTTNGLRFVYKPRSLAVDAHLQELLAWTNARGVHPPFATLKILDRGAYGWVEFVEHRGCRSVAELCRFYERQGAYLALLYALEATDIHFENSIACGEHPYLVDVETLFHPSTRAIRETKTDPGSEALRSSVLRVGILPYRSFADGLEEGIDLSALGGAAGQRSPFPVPSWQDIATDEMRLQDERPATTERRNRPTLDGKPVELSEYRDSFSAGFEAMYRMLCEHRSELLAPDGPLARFENDETRFVARPTVVYASLRQASHHPDVLRDAIDRDALFGWLWLSAADYRPAENLAVAEVRELRVGDIPRFTTYPGSRTIITSDEIRHPDFFEEPGMALVRRKLMALGEADLARQSWIVRATLSTGVPVSSVCRKRVVTDGMSCSASLLIELAVQIGERIARAALHEGGGASWISRMRTAKGRSAISPVGVALYDGLAGITLFCAHLARISGERPFERLARETLQTMRNQSNQVPTSGAFDGASGIVYALTHLGCMWGDRALLGEAHALACATARQALDERMFDVISGAAGCLVTLLALNEVAPSDELVRGAVALGDRLVEQALRIPRGCAWASPIAATGPLTGFGHGAAGIGWALAELFQWSRDNAHRQAALGAFEYEQSVYSHEHRNWPDLRSLGAEGEANFGLGWCHGAPGIVLARLRAARHLDAPDLLAHVQEPLRHLDDAFGWAHCMCHGDLGNLETLREANALLKGQDWQARYERQLSRAVHSGAENGWLLDGSDENLESPGLMTGLAGVGLGLLRAAAPTSVPSVLRLAPPNE